MSHVQPHGQVFRVMVLKEFMKVPQGSTDIVAARMILIDGLYAELLVEGHEVLENGTYFIQLLEHRFLEIVFVIAHAIALHSQLGGNLKLLRIQLVVRIVDAGCHDGELKLSFSQGLHHLGEFIWHLFGCDMTAGTNGALDAVEAKPRGEVGQIIVAELLKRLAEKTEWIAERCYESKPYNNLDELILKMMKI